MAALEWLHGTKATAGGVRNLESLHTLALFFPLLGMAIPTVSAAICYWSSDTVFSGYEGVSGSRRHTPENAWYLEPFAAPANLAFWFAGLGLFLMPYLSNDHLPATVFAVAIYLNLLGACSMSFHMDASATGTWQHVADRFGMFLVFGHLAVAVFSGLWHACWGVEQRPRSLFALIINVLALVYASYLFIYQASIDTMIFLIGTGFVIFSANYFTLAILRFRAIDPDQRCGACCGEWWSKLGWLFAGLPTLITRLTLLGVAFAMNMSSATARDTAARTSDPVTGIELRAQHDMLHGTWHFAVAVVIMGMGLALLEGLSGSLELAAHAPPDSIAARAGNEDSTRHVTFKRRIVFWETYSMAFTFSVTMVFLTLFLMGVHSSVWLYMWVILIAVGLPALGVYRVVTAFDESVPADMRALMA